MRSFDFIDIILFLGISQGIFLAITIQIIQNKNASANKVLSLILLIASLMLTGRLFYFRAVTSEWFFRVAVFVDTLIFVFGPLLYLYFRRLIFNESPRYRLHISSFIPAVGMIFYFFWTLTFPVEEFVGLAKEGKLTLLFFIIETSGLVFNFFYCFRCFQLIRMYKKEEKKNLSYSQHLTSFLLSFLITIMVFMVFWLVSYVMVYFLQMYSPTISYNLVWVSIPIFIYVIGFYSLKQPNIFRIPWSKKRSVKPKERLEGEAIENLKIDLERLMVEEKVYLDHTLTLSDLAKKMNTSANNVSWLLNNIHKSSFYDYINHYRVQSFIHKVQKGEHHHHTLLALSLDSGFNSKSTFNKAFKAELKDTPSSYIKKLETI